MKKKIAALVAAGVLLLSAAAAFASQPPKGEKGLKGQAGKSNVAFVELWEKDSSWEIVEDGAWGKLKYNLSGSEFEYLFNGHGLETFTNYSLIYYPEPQTTWPWSIIVLGEGMTNMYGDVHIQGESPFACLKDAKIWLVLKNDIVGDSISGWQPNEYLFEHSVIGFNEEQSIEGNWLLSFLYGNTTYRHDMTVATQSCDGAFSGTGSYPSGGPPYSITWTVTGNVNGSNVNFRIDYDNSSYYVEVTGVIEEGGDISGDWRSNLSQSGTWTGKRP